MRFTFPEGFLWGAATSAHQVEGGNFNDWTEWEIKNAERMARESGGKYPPENYISGRAADHYNRYEEDFNIAKSLGHNTHRFSIEWSRVEPEEGKFDQEAIEHYREVIVALRERGMEPFVTLWHWTVPQWFQSDGGWLHSRAPQRFIPFVRKVAEELGDSVTFWCTLNEPEVFIAYGYIAGIRPPQEQSIRKAVVVFRRLVAAHRMAFLALHEVATRRQRSCAVGIAKHDKWFVAADRSLKNLIAYSIARFLWNDAFLRRIRRYQDYIGLNYYNRNTISFGWSKPRWGLYNLKVSPEGFYRTLLRLRRYGTPIYVLENGLEDPTDRKRPRFIWDHLVALAEAIRDGVDIRGYFYWSLLDNFEWENGFWPRFGLVEVDYKTLERRVRPSARAYAEICRTNNLKL